jgi:hypothetical protein
MNVAENTSVNDQITDSITQIQKMLTDDNGENIQAFSYQLMAHAIGLAMYNAVHQQQQRYILQNAITSAASKAILEASPEKALKMAEESLGDNSFTQTLSELKAMMDSLNSTYRDVVAGLKKNATNTTKSSPKPAVKKAARKTVKRPRRK